MAKPGGTVALFAFLGLGWGVLARLWMRFISTSPDFSWAGTAVLAQTWVLAGPLRGLAATVWYLALVGGMILILRISFAPVRGPAREVPPAQAPRPTGSV